MGSIPSSPPIKMNIFVLFQNLLINIKKKKACCEINNNNILKQKEFSSRWKEKIVSRNLFIILCLQFQLLKEVCDSCKTNLNKQKQFWNSKQGY